MARVNPFTMLHRPSRPILTRNFKDPGQEHEITLALRIPNAIDISRSSALVNEMIARYVDGGTGQPQFPYHVEDPSGGFEQVTTTAEFWSTVCQIHVSQPDIETQKAGATAGAISSDQVYEPYTCEELAQIALKCPVAWPQIIGFYHEVIGRAVLEQEADDPNPNGASTLE